MENKFCSGCGSKLEKVQAFCSNCGKKNVSSEQEEKKNNNIETKQEIKTENTNDNLKESKKKKTSVGDVIRYIFGGLFCFSGVSALSQGDWLGITFLLVGLSLFPFIYRRYVCKIITNNNWLKALQIILPIFLIILSIAVTPEDDIDTANGGNEVSKGKDEKKVLQLVQRSLYSDYQEIIDMNINKETGNLDFKIKDTKQDLNAYTCALDMQEIAKQIAGVKKAGNVEFECINNGQAFYYVSVGNLGTLSVDTVNANTKYYDANHNAVNTNIDTLKANVISDYKNSCATYNYKDVLRNPSDYNGKKAYWFGKIIQVVDKSQKSSTFRIDVTCQKNQYLEGYFCDDTIYVTYYGEQSFIEDDMVKMWGSMDGTKSYTTVLGAGVTIPKFNAKYMELQ